MKTLRLNAEGKLVAGSESKPSLESQFPTVRVYGHTLTRLCKVGGRVVVTIGENGYAAKYTASVLGWGYGQLEAEGNNCADLISYCEARFPGCKIEQA